MLNIAFVGCAHIHTRGFVKFLQDRPEFTQGQLAVKYLWDPVPARAAYFATALGQGAVVKTPSKIWKDPAVDAVVICSQTNEHRKLVAAAGKAGKHMFVEKPLGLAGKDSLAMAKLVSDAGVKFQTGYFNRGLAAYRFIKQEIDAGQFGVITRADAWNCHNGVQRDLFASKPHEPALDWRWMADPSKAGCGAFGDLGTHMLDILMWMMGDIQSVAAHIRPVVNRYDNCDEAGQALIRFANGATGSLAAGWVDVANPVTLAISGTKAHAAVVQGKLYYTNADVKGADGVTPFELPADLSLPHAFHLFIDALLGKPAQLVPVDEAARRVVVMEAMYTASKRSRWVMPKMG